MKPTQYTDKVLDHFRNPRNVGTLEGEGVAMGRVGNPVCGDLMEIYIRVKNEKIEEIKFRTFGCGSAVATASMVTEMARGKSLDEAMRITRNDVASRLDGLPPAKMHCSNLAADALHDAVKNYRSAKKGKRPVPDAPQVSCQEIAGGEDFLGRGVVHEVKDLTSFKDRRVMILDRGDESIDLALKLIEHTGRVVFVTRSKEIAGSAELKSRLRRSDVKVLYESDLLEVKGASAVEKVVIHDLNEDEEYELSVDSVVILSDQNR